MFKHIVEELEQLWFKIYGCENPGLLPKKKKLWEDLILMAYKDNRIIDVKKYGELKLQLLEFYELDNCDPKAIKDKYLEDWKAQVKKMETCHCGNHKNRNAKQCFDCFDKERKEKKEKFNPKTICPSCGDIKTPKAKICRDCMLEEVRKKKEENMFCPKCGKQKTPVSTYCIDCSRKERKNKKYKKRG